MTYCAIDFGTSNSAVAVPAAIQAQTQGGHSIRLAPVEGEATTLPTAVFFNTDENSQSYGRAALESYIDGFDGRLMRSMKSILGSPLADTSTDLGDGSAIKYTDVITLFLQHLKQKAQAVSPSPLDRAVLGRPVFSSMTIRAPTALRSRNSKRARTPSACARFTFNTNRSPPHSITKRA